MISLPNVRPRKYRRHQFFAAIAAVVLVTALWVFVFAPKHPPVGGDPGNKHLNELRADAVFATLPPGAHLTGPIAMTTAKYRRPAFEPAGWDGPSVVASFVSDQPVATVFKFYAAQAITAGWGNQVDNADVWTKTYPDHAPATLRLEVLDGGSSTSERAYKLTGSI